MIKLPIGVDINNLIDDLRIFSWEAADTLIFYSKILKDSSNDIKIIQNNNFDDPVTLADLKVNELIINRIKEKYKNINWEILSEENVKVAADECNTQCDWIWVLDPLDGTKDFIQGTSDFAMHLALNYKKRPYLGIVLIPEKDELWISNGEKVWCEKRNGKRKMPNTNKFKSLKEMVLVTSKNHRNETLKKLIQEIKFKEVIVMGSIGCKVASIIRGDSDIYISLSLPGQSNPKDWDFAAPEAILRAAGGTITNLNNENLSYFKTNFDQQGIIIASMDINSHEYFCIEIRKIIEKYDLYPLNA